MSKSSGSPLISKYPIPSNNIELQTRIVEAARRGDITEVKRLIDWKCNVTIPDKDGRFPLIRILENSSYSDKEGLFQAAKELTKAGAKFDDSAAAAAKKVPFTDQQLKLLQAPNHQIWDDIPLNNTKGNPGNPGETAEVYKTGESPSLCDIL